MCDDYNVFTCVTDCVTNSPKNLCDKCGKMYKCNGSIFSIFSREPLRVLVREFPSFSYFIIRALSTQFAWKLQANVANDDQIVLGAAQKKEHRNFTSPPRPSSMETSAPGLEYPVVRVRNKLQPKRNKFHNKIHLSLAGRHELCLKQIFSLRNWRNFLPWLRRTGPPRRTALVIKGN